MGNSRRLVESIKENLPERNVKTIKKIDSEDSGYKNDVLKGLSSINEQIVEISQFAINKMMSYNDETNHIIDSIRSSIDNQRYDSKQLHQELHQEQKQDIQHLISIAESIDKRFCQLNNGVENLNEQIGILIAQQKDLLSKTKSLGKQIDDFIELIFLIDSSGNMSGKRVETLNISLRKLISNLSRQSRERSFSLKLSVLEYSTDTNWQYPAPVFINEYEWKDIKGNGLTSFGRATYELSNHINANKLDYDCYRIICLFTDGAPTDDYRVPADKLYSSKNFINSFKIGIGIGSDYDESIIEDFVADNGQKLYFPDNSLGNLFGNSKRLESIDCVLGSAIMSYIEHNLLPQL